MENYMMNNYKVYVEVNEDRKADGQILPRSFVWEDGRRFEVDRVLDIRRAAALKAGGAGIRYTVQIEGRERYMWLEGEDGQSRWFLERRGA
jgi:hypothetical protein